MAKSRIEWKCKKCGRTYKTQEEGWYFTSGGKKKYPCKICISEYNKTDAQKKTRYAANKRYRKTEKGKLASTLAKYRWLDKKEAEMDLSKLREVNSDKKPECKGIICRAKVYDGFTQTYQRNRIVSKIVLTILKKDSCPGCERCGGLWDQLSEISNDWPVGNMGDAIDGRKYHLSMREVSRDWETGLCDEWEYYITEVRDAKKNMDVSG